MSTYYISPLNQSESLGTAGAHTGSIEAAALLNGTTITNGGATLSNCLSAFKFYTTITGSENTSAALYPSGRELDARWTAINKAITTFTNGTMTPNVLEIKKELARSVFGNNESFDYFSNQSALDSAISTAFTTCLSGVNTNVANNPVVALGNAMMYRNPARFALKYNAAHVGTAAGGTASIYKSCVLTGSFGSTPPSAVVHVTVSGGAVTQITLVSVSGTFVLNEETTISDPNGHTDLSFKLILTSDDVTRLNTPSLNTDFSLAGVEALIGYEHGVYTQVPVLVGETDSGARVTVRLANDHSISSIHTTTIATTPLARTNTVIFTDGAGSGNNISISSINPIQVAMLNGTLDDSVNGTSFPFETNDVIRVKYSFSNNSQQYVAGSSSTVAVMDYACYMDFVVA